MIPRLQARGTSFKGSCKYILHDPNQAKTSERVSWALTQNLHSHPDDAWFEMQQTWRDQDAIKRNAGVSTRGRKNTSPVLHYTLAWHADDQPSPEEMKAAALASLKVLGLDEHEALIAGHKDKLHPHVHIVVNTVHPYTGKTAALKYSKERLSEWAERYERERGEIRCEERVRNNEKRRDIRQIRDSEKLTAVFANAVDQPLPAPIPYVPVKDRSPSRPEWFEKKDIVDRMKCLRAQLDLTHKIERGLTWERQRRERDALDTNTKSAADHARGVTRQTYRPLWREMYRAQAKEIKIVQKTATHPFERAVFVFRNRNRLGRGKPLSWQQMARMILSGKRLNQALQSAHERERRGLARTEKLDIKQRMDRIYGIHREKLHALAERQATERAAERGHQQLARKDISFARARQDLVREHALPRPPTPRPVPTASLRDDPSAAFNLAAWQMPESGASRAEQIRSEMADWRRRRPDHDQGREL
jgi:hypothetical protein